MGKIWLSALLAGVATPAFAAVDIFASPMYMVGTDTLQPYVTNTFGSGVVDTALGQFAITDGGFFSGGVTANEHDAPTPSGAYLAIIGEAELTLTSPANEFSLNWGTPAYNTVCTSAGQCVTADEVLAAAGFAHWWRGRTDVGVGIPLDELPDYTIWVEVTGLEPFNSLTFSTGGVPTFELNDIQYGLAQTGIPEPGTWLMFGIGLTACAGLRKVRTAA